MLDEIKSMAKGFAVARSVYRVAAAAAALWAVIHFGSILVSTDESPPAVAMQATPGFGAELIAAEIPVGPDGVPLVPKLEILHAEAEEAELAAAPLLPPIDELESPPEQAPPPADVPKESPVAVIETQPKSSLAEAMDRPGDVTFRNTTIEAALFTIGETWNVNIIAGKDIQGSVNGVFKQTPLKEILDAVLLANGYSYRQVGDSLVVQAVGDVGSANPLFRSATVPIRNSNLEEIVQGAQLLASATGQVKSLPSARSVLVLDYADRVEQITAFIARMENAAAENVVVSGLQPRGELEVTYFHTHFIPVANAQQPLLAVLSPMGRLAMMPRENRMLVVDYPTNIEMVRKVLARIDRPRPQVRITALIYDLSLEDVEKLGVNWGSAAKGNTVNAEGLANQSLQFETTTIAPFSAGQAGGGFTVRSLTRNFDINSIVELLQNANDARLLAKPSVTVTDNELAEWKSVSEIPYQQITQSELGGQIGTTAFKEAGIILRVEPTIAGDGTIEMMVEPEFSRLAGFTPKDSQPIIDTRKATTRVRVVNRQTVVISGLRQRSDTGEFNGIPWIKDVKYIGPLFRSRDTNVRESELIVFIMPEVVAYDEPLDGRTYQALETVGCRLDAIPLAEGCPGCGGQGSGCADMVPAELPPPDAPPTEEMPVEGAEEGAFEQVEPPKASPQAANHPASHMRPSYEARFRADGRRMHSDKTKPTEEPPRTSTWKRMFRS